MRPVYRAAHTPGPWAIDSELPPNSRSVIARVSGIPISGNTSGPHSEEEDRPNARLIAAAPELLEALQMCIAWIECSDAPGSGSMGNKIAHADIAKATGAA